MKIMDRNIYRATIAKKNIRNLNIQLLEFDRNIEYHIVKKIMRYTHNFIILLTDSEEKITVYKYQKHVCSLRNIDNILSNIFCGKIYSETESVTNITNKEYIIFVSKDYGTGRYTSYYGTNVNSFHFTYLIDNLKHFHLYDYYFYDSHAIVRLANGGRSDGVKIIDNNKLQDGSKIVLSPLVGIGDYFMMFSILYEYVVRQSRKGIEVYFTVVDNNIPIISLLSVMFPQNKCVRFDNGSMYNYCLSVENKEVISLATIHIRECMEGKYNVQGYHITDTIKEILGIEADFPIYKHSKYLMERIISSLSKEEKKYIDTFFEKTNYVALQYFTGSYDDVNDIWVTNTYRNWDQENIKKFVELCNHSNIEVIIFSGQPYYNINIKKIKTDSILSYIYALSKIKVLVGIDSSGGHIASFYNIPSITIWGKQTHMFYQITDTSISEKKASDFRISFRPIRRNVSIYSRKRSTNMVLADKVFSWLVYILEEKVEFEETNIKYDDNKNCICI